MALSQTGSEKYYLFSSFFRKNKKSLEDIFFSSPLPSTIKMKIMGLKKKDNAIEEGNQKKKQQQGKHNLSLQNKKKLNAYDVTK